MGHTDHETDQTVCDVMEEFRTFLIELANNLTSLLDIPDGVPSQWWSRIDEGSLFLNSKEYQQYHHILRKLMDSGRCKYLSENQIDSALQDAIFEAVDILKRRNDDVTQRVQCALGKLNGLLNSPVIEYECWVEIGGIDLTTQPIWFGEVQFKTFRCDQIQRLQEIIRTKHTAYQDEKIEALEGKSSKSFLEKPFAIVKTKARDAKYAMESGRKKVQTAIELLNFFSGLVTGCNGWLYIATHDAGKKIGRCFVLSENGDYNHNLSVGDPLGTFSIQNALESPGEIGDAVRQLDNLLRSVTSEVDRLLLTAFRWGGTATTARSTEDSFLQFIVALECLLLPERYINKKRLRLSRRAAGLLSKDESEHRRFITLIEDYYNLRSEIAHDGFHEVSESYLIKSRAITKRLIVKVFLNEEARSCETKSDYEKWLRRFENAEFSHTQ